MSSNFIVNSFDTVRRVCFNCPVYPRVLLLKLDSRFEWIEMILTKAALPHRTDYSNCHNECGGWYWDQPYLFRPYTICWHCHRHQGSRLVLSQFKNQNAKLPALYGVRADLKTNQCFNYCSVRGCYFFYFLISSINIYI